VGKESFSEKTWKGSYVKAGLRENARDEGGGKTMGSEYSRER